MKCLFYLLIVFSLTSCVEGPTGESLYNGQCAGCHGKEGEGLGQLIPPLANSDFIEKDKGNLSCIILYGMNGPVVVNGVTYNGTMPGVPKLSKAEIANLINYINQKWYKDKPVKTIPDVAAELLECENLSK